VGLDISQLLTSTGSISHNIVALHSICDKSNTQGYRLVPDMASQGGAGGSAVSPDNGCNAMGNLDETVCCVPVIMAHSIDAS
jgi:hypothetical protein